MAKKRYQTRLPADQAEQVDEYIEQRQISEAEGVRRLVLAGLEAEGMEDSAGVDSDEDDADEADEDAEVVDASTRTLRSGQMGATFLQWIQIVLLVVIAALVVGL
jgi:hypothetical protein